MAVTFKVDIENQDYYEILSEVGYPIVTESSLELSKEAVIDYAVYPSVREYWSWFPINQITSMQVSCSDFEIDFPTIENEKWSVIGITDARVNTKRMNTGTVSSNVFLNNILYQVRGGNYGQYGTRNDYGMTDYKIMYDAYNNSMQNTIRATRINVDMQNKKVKGFCNSVGELIVTWAEMSSVFDDIPFVRKTEVINLAKSKLLRLLYQLRMQVDASTGVKFNGDVFKGRADFLEEKVMKKWREMSKVVIIKS